MSVKKGFMLAAAVFAIVFVVVTFQSLFETNIAGYIQVKQAAVTGELTCKLDPGLYGRFFGDIHTYPEATTFHFTADSEMGERRDQSLKTTFNDGAESKISGSVRVLLPETDCDKLLTLHRKFKNKDNLMVKLVLPGVRLAVFTSGPHMSATESYAARRVEFVNLIRDQLLRGTIVTDKEKVEVTDLITGETKSEWRVRKVTCEKENGRTCVNGYKREESAFSEFDVRLTNFVVDDIIYPKQVMLQIEEQRKARMSIITKQAEAKLADARASKAEADGRAQIAETRAIEEVNKTQFIVRAEAEKEKAILNAERVKAVAKLEKEAAEFEKKKQILLGEGEATRKRLVMQADGALEKKLDAWVKAQEAYAKALATAKPGALVPTLVMGSRSGGGNDALDLIQLLTARTAKDLAVDLGVRK